MDARRGLNERITAIPPSDTLRIGALARALAASGRTVYGFGAGEPDFDTPDAIKEAAAEALRRGETKYTPVEGTGELRSLIARKLREENGLEYAPEQIVVSNGAKHTLFNVILTICREGDEVVVPAPYWLSYPEMLRVAGAVPVFVRGAESNAFKITAEQLAAAATGRTTAVILNSPCNPTGAVYERRELEALAAVAAERNLWIISDEIYEKLVYDGAEHSSVGALSRDALSRTITVNGFSKAFSMTGWRLGYGAAPLPVAKAMAALQSHSTSGPNTFAQWGAVAALKLPADSVRTMVAAFAQRREAMYRGLAAVPGIRCVKPMGAFYMLADISAFGMDSNVFAERLIGEEGVAVVPGRPFGAAGSVRLSYACGLDTIERGMDGLRRFAARL
jgi:aspartate aminotransferase